MRNAKFLGVVIYDTISWEHFIQALQRNVSKSVGILYRAASKLCTGKKNFFRYQGVIYYIMYTYIAILAALC